ncbi:Sodium-driven multidrug efflux pump [Giardia duodenalis]|uniref:Sodium-driven multidrug efflux pump n=1 Tax=Giardia intestinalis TaxID=5741 RepID=V6U330_GIAIN|nr:Sodium-driven multidrug efflux pump [Giardia intestinalis]
MGRNFYDDLEEDKPAAESSIGSGTDKTLDSTIMKLTTANVNILLWSTALPYICGFLLEGLAFIGDYSLVIYYPGFAGLYGMSLIYPVEIIVAKNITLGYGLATAGAIQKALAKNKASLASSYLAHYIMLSLLWSILCTICLTPAAIPLLKFIDNYQGNERGMAYSRIVLGTQNFVNIFTNSISQVLAVENRVALNLFRHLSSSFLFIFFDFIIYFISSFYSSKIPELCQSSAIAYTLAHAVVSIWILCVLFKKTAFDIQIKTSLDLKLKRFWPLNRKVIKTIMLGSLPPILFNSAVPATILVCNILVSRYYTSAETVNASRLKFMTYIRYNNLFMFINNGFNQAFITTCGFNLGLKNYGRVRQLIVASALWTLVLSAILGILMFIFYTNVAQLFYPILKYRQTESEWSATLRQYEETYESISFASLGPIWMGLFMTVSSIAQLEDKFLVFVLLQVSRIVVPIIFAISAGLLIQDNAKLLVSLPIGDGVAGMCCLTFLFYYLQKYKHLSLIEQSRKENEALEAQIANLDGLND